MAMTFDATLKDMARECPEGFLAAFDRAPTASVSVLNVELSTITAAADVVYGLGEPLREIIHIECQSSAAKWKHADLLLYNALLFARYYVPVHTVVVLLRPEAAHANMDGTVDYAPRPAHGSMSFRYQTWPRRFFRGIGMMEESDTYLMIVDQGKEKEAKRAILLFGEERLGSADESI